MNSRHRRCTLNLRNKYRALACILALSSLPLQADERDYFDLPLEDLLQITVTSAFPEDFLNASSSVSVITADDWERRGARRPADVMAGLPSTMTYSSLAAHAIAIRGFTQSSSVRGISTLLDGVPLNGYAFGSALYDKFQWDLTGMKRMEVVRGPSSALYGSDAFHGVIAMESYDSEHDEQQLNAHLGSNNYWQTSWRASQALGKGWRLQGSVAASEKPGEDRDYYYTDAGSITRQSAFDYRDDRQSAILKLDSGQQASGQYDIGIYSNRYAADDHPGIGQSFSPGISLSGGHDLVDSDTRFNMLRTRGRWNLTDTQALEAQAYHWQSQLDTWLDLQENPFFMINQLTRTEERREGLELKLKQHLGQHTDWLLVGSGDRQHIDQRQTRRFTPDGQPVSTTLDGSNGATRNTLGIANQFKTRLLDDHLTLVYGGRYDDFSDIGHKFTPRLGAILQPDQENAFKLLYGRAFRAPTAVELYGIAGALGNLKLKPEVIDTYELVYMYQGESWRSELVLFESHWKNGIVLGTCTGPQCGSLLLEYQNIAENKAHGVEWIVAIEQDNWRIQPSVSYTESYRYSDNVSGQEIKTRYSAFPRWMAGMDIGYEWPRGMELFITNNLRFDMSEGVGSPTSNSSETRLKDYWRTDLHLSQRLGKQAVVSLDLFNLFDRQNWIPGVWNTENGLEDKARTLTFGISYNF